jgi:Tol biopolymer transport system component
VQGQLSAQRFNPATGDVSGEPARVADDVVGGPSISVSDNGVLTFRHLRQPARQLVWYARDGKEQSAVGESGTTIGRFSINPDGKSVAVVRTIEGRSDIWLEGSYGGSTTRLTFESAVDSAPVWSLDGQRLYYPSTRDGGAQVVERPANGLGAERVLHREPGIVYRPLSISRDGGWLVLRMGGAGESALSFLSLADGKMVRLQEGARVNYGSLSPDGRWLAYEMRTAAVSDVFVRGAPAELNRSTVDAKQQISAGGGLRPQWRADGKEIVYVTPDGSVTSVPVEITNGGLRTGPPRVLFKLAGGAPLDMSADGQRFLVGRAISESDPPVTVIVNWPKLLRQ